MLLLITKICIFFISPHKKVSLKSGVNILKMTFFTLCFCSPKYYVFLKRFVCKNSQNHIWWCHLNNLVGFLQEIWFNFQQMSNRMLISTIQVNLRLIGQPKVERSTKGWKVNQRSTGQAKGQLNQELTFVVIKSW